MAKNRTLSSPRIVLRSTLTIIGLGAVGFSGWLCLLPQPREIGDAPAIPAEEIDATLAALRPSKHEHPVIAIVGLNDSTEITDYLVPLGFSGARASRRW